MLNLLLFNKTSKILYDIKNVINIMKNIYKLKFIGISVNLFSNYKKLLIFII